MKKRFSVVALVLSIVMGISIFSGCKLVTTDIEKDYNQVIATVQVSKDAPVDNIYKKDVALSYMNAGYYYTSYLGYTQQQTIEYIVEGLIQNRILVQTAMEYYAQGSCSYKVDDYLDAEGKIDAEYDAYKGLNDLIDSYENTNEKATSKDTLADTVRTIPTDAKNAEKELTTAEKEVFINECKTNNFNATSSTARRNAFNKVVKLLDANGLLGSKYNGKLNETNYFTQVLESGKEEALLTKYKNELTVNAIKTIIPDFTALEAEYNSIYTNQTEFNNEEFATALKDASASSPVLYGAFGNYGYVYNLLLGVNDIQAGKISKIDSTLSQQEKEQARREILADTKAKDLRSTWILSGYDFDGTKFTGDYAFLEDSIPFQGTTTLIKEADEDEGTSAQYRVDSVKSFGLDEFIKEFVNKYVYNNESEIGVETLTGSYYKKYNKASGVENYEKKINELLFAFSTDSGSLNTFKGYIISPSNAESWVSTFFDAGKQLLEMGGQSYIIVASDYGYHIMFFSQKFTVGQGFDSLTKYLEDGLGLETPQDGWANYYMDMVNNWNDFEDTDSYVYLLASSVASSRASTEVSNTTQKIVNSLRYNEDNVKVYSDRYEDLLG